MIQYTLVFATIAAIGGAVYLYRTNRRIAKLKKAEENKHKSESVVQWAYDYFSSIPEDKWTTEAYVDRSNHFQRCAEGHIYSHFAVKERENAGSLGMMFDKGIPEEALQKEIAFKLVKDLNDLIMDWSRDKESLTSVITLITANDGAGSVFSKGHAYSFPTPKARVLAILSDMIKAGY